ncbi:MAG: hypothetical protein IVW54_13730 [Candidatus Binataceae bacterium]|nr:hypothetical protein [Candidatus Binataceae bacterium]
MIAIKRGCIAESKVAALVILLACGGCDPVINIAGANFPAWLLCAIVGAALTALIRPILDAVGIEPYLGPLPLIYPCLAVLIGCLVWLICFNRI